MLGNLLHILSALILSASYSVAHATTVIMNSGFLGHLNSKEATVITSKNKKIPLSDETRFYSGGVCW